MAKWINEPLCFLWQKKNYAWAQGVNSPDLKEDESPVLRIRDKPDIILTHSEGHKGSLSIEKQVWAAR